MRNHNNTISGRLAAQARIVSATLIAAFMRRARTEDVMNWIDDMPAGQRRLVVGTTLGLLFIAALIAAQFGVIGMCVYFVGVILLVR